ncbi:hypothetical protein F9B77_07375 [Staphylococcus epidermidis]|nr:hypothetical protein CPZ17_10215 [Staphylococcus epidermidis]EHS00731.1 hypothetical protein SEVCU128_0798 [Staphylococcus epidermidis VCU128]EPZ40914.1 hypothetical protein HMPREF1157_1377 [Staphylococcus epidermidis E13A]KAA9389698.1 hypothetical protein F6I16_07785 [Staphylococcus epidermidis]KAB2158096.1 hypothetical protein F9B18_07115 [Staphylococcus epidermidis]
MFYVKQKLLLFRKLGDLNNIFTTIDLRYKLKVNDTFRLINMDEKGYCVWYINF